VASQSRGKASNRSLERPEPPVIRRFKRKFRWTNVALEPYKADTDGPPDFRNASRQVLIGKKGERVAFHVRYFELQPGGCTSYERHRHSHVVIAIRGRGRATVEKSKLTLKPFDTLYIGPNLAHRLRATKHEPFGFFCIVDATRDRPRPVKEKQSRSQTKGTQQ
jgi:ribulose-bisphosphate carboxylase large chain